MSLDICAGRFSVLLDCDTSLIKDSQVPSRCYLDDDARVTLLVHQVKPPFLDGRVSFSTIREAVPTVRDSSSDFAKMARNGSATLRRLRENKVRSIWTFWFDSSVSLVSDRCSHCVIAGKAYHETEVLGAWRHTNG